ncbi:MAG: M60 family metallopeptidase [Planctomycetia bacterium]|nr:M60 family metallopeptidase [Planctomycetia bacterium]
MNYVFHFSLCLSFFIGTINLSSTVLSEVNAKQDSLNILTEAIKNQASFHIPASEFTVTTNSFQPYTGEIIKAFDGNVRTIWHTAWRKPETYPYYVDVEFRQEEEIDKINYLPRIEGFNGNFLNCNVYKKEGDEWVKIQTRKFLGSNALQTIFLPQVKTRALRLEIIEGVEGYASAAEIAFFRPDPEAKKIASLFTEVASFEVSPAKKMELKNQLESIQKNTKRKEIFEEAKLALSVLENPKSLKENEVLVPQKPSTYMETKWRRGGLPWSYFLPTGYTVKAGQVFAVMLKTDPCGSFPNLIIADSRSYNWNRQISFSLSPGWNFFVAPASGILYMDNPYESDLQKFAPVVHFANVTPMPFYLFGKTTPQQWKKMLEMPNPYGMAEICTNRVLITVSEKNIKKYLDDPEALCKSMNHMMDTYARLLGFSENEAPPHRRPVSLMHMYEVDHMYMYATSFRTAYHFHSVKPIINNNAFQKDGWGPWHEVGHMHQVPQYQSSDLTEVTVNIFSLEMQLSLGQKARIDAPETIRAMKRFLADPNRDYNKNNDVFMKLCMFWQLRMAFGENFYPQLHRYYREHDLPIKTDQDKMQYLVRVSSKISGYDLSPFFTAWGIHMTDETKNIIQEYKKLETPIWEATNFSTILPEGTVGIYTPSSVNEQ